MNTLKAYLVLSAIMLPLTGAMAQSKIGKEVEVTRPYDPSVMDAQKIWYEPSINPDSLQKKDAFSYSVFPKNMSTGFGLTPITSASLVENNQEYDGIGYVRVGAGYPFSTLLDFYISNNNASNILLGMYANHKGYWDNVKLKNDYAEKNVDASNMSNDIGIFAKKAFYSSKLSLNADYSGRRLLFYGYDPQIFYTPYDLSYNKDSVRQTFDLFNVNLQFESATTGDDRYDYALGASYQHFKDHYDNKEAALSIFGMLGKHFGEEHALSVTVRGSSYNRDNRLDTIGNNFLLSIIPSYVYTSGDFTGKIGLQFMADQYNKESRSYVYPALSASYHIADYFVPTLELKGETEVNSYRKLAYDCNYIRPGLDSAQLLGNAQKFRNTYHRLVAVFSIKGDISSEASYNVFASYDKLEKMAFFVNEPYWDTHFITPPLNFTNNLEVFYDDGSKVSIGGEFQLNSDPIRLYAKAVYNKYTLDQLDYAIHRPTFEADFTGSYKLDEWVFSLTFHMATGRHYMWKGDPGPFMIIVPAEYAKMDDIYNLGAGVEYFFTPRFSAFGSVSNLLNRSYDNFHQYTVPGLTLMGGIAFSF